MTIQEQIEAIVAEAERAAEAAARAHRFGRTNICKTWKREFQSLNTKLSGLLRAKAAGQ